MSAISSLSGKVVSIYKAKYFDGDDTKEFIKLLRKKMKPKPIALFWDNAAIHRRKDIERLLKKTPAIFNIPYAPEFNGIEKYWAVMK